MNFADVQNVPIDSITPYENNPRKISEKAVTAVRESIERYGWQQPIVVDQDGVIIVGHTRHRAAREMGLAEVPVLRVDNLTDDQVKEYRLVDNKTGEMTEWDTSMLHLELREFDQDLLDTFFSGMQLEVSFVESAATVTQDEIDLATQKVETFKERDAESTHTTGVQCPSCLKEFQVRTQSLPGVDPQDISEMISGGAN